MKVKKDNKTVTVADEVGAILIKMHGYTEVKTK